MLAPLFDKMVDADPSKRFTAKEALQFFEEQYAMLTEEQLDSKPAGIPENKDFTHPELCDRWIGLPEEFVKAYGHLRMSKIGLSSKIMRFLCRNWRIRYSIQYLRRLLQC